MKFERLLEPSKLVFPLFVDLLVALDLCAVVRFLGREKRLEP